MKPYFLGRKLDPLTAVGIGTVLLAGAASAAPADTTNAPLAALNKADSVQVTETLSFADHDGALHPSTIFNVSLLRPGKLHIEQVKIGETTPNFIVTSDGVTSFRYDTTRKQYTKMKASLKNLPALADYSTAAAPTDTVLDGKPALFYKVTQEGNGQKITEELWVDPATHLPVQQTLLLGVGDAAKEVERVAFSNWMLGKPLAPTLFAFTPPTGATEFIPKPLLPTPALLAKGTAAPDFTVQDSEGKSVKLSDYRGKVVVLDFWATWCGPCQKSLPHTNEVAKAFKDKNVVVLGVNVWDKKDAFDKWLPEHTQYDTISFLIDTAGNGKDVATALYKVSGIPTQYVIDPKGNIAQSFVGYGGPSDDLANALKAAGASS